MRTTTIATDCVIKLRITEVQQLSAQLVLVAPVLLVATASICWQAKHIALRHTGVGKVSDMHDRLLCGGGMQARIRAVHTCSSAANDGPRDGCRELDVDVS